MRGKQNRDQADERETNQDVNNYPFGDWGPDILPVPGTEPFLGTFIFFN